MNNKSFFYHNNYISALDLLNKYNLKTVYNLPNLSSLKIELNLNTLQQDLNVINTDEFKIKLFLFLYLFNSMPFVSIEKANIKKQKKLKENDLNFLLFLKLKNKKSLECFLFFIFSESWDTLLKDNISFSFVGNSVNQNNFFFNVNVQVSALKCFDNILSNKDTFDFSTKDLNLKLNFFIRTPLLLRSKKLLLYNLPPLFFIQ